MSAARTLPYGDHPEQVGDLHLPPGDGPHPVVVLWHGGSYETEYGRDMLTPLAEALAERGVAAWNVTYRRLGSDGGVPETFDDALAAVDVLRQLPAPLDLREPPAGIGFSAGAPLALHAAAENRLSRVVDLAGVSMLATAASAGGPGSSVWRLFGGDASQASEAYARFDPVERLPLPVPLLVVHGEADAHVPVEMSRAFAERVGDACRLVTYPGAGHFDLHVPPAPATDELFAFLA